MKYCKHISTTSNRTDLYVPPGWIKQWRFYRTSLPAPGESKNIKYTEAGGNMEVPEEYVYTLQTVFMWFVNFVFRNCYLG